MCHDCLQIAIVLNIFERLTYINIRHIIICNVPTNCYTYILYSLYAYYFAKQLKTELKKSKTLKYSHGVSKTNFP